MTHEQITHLKCAKHNAHCHTEIPKHSCMIVMLHISHFTDEELRGDVAESNSHSGYGRVGVTRLASQILHNLFLIVLNELNPKIHHFERAIFHSGI